MKTLSRKNLSIVFPGLGNERDNAADKFCAIVPLVDPSELKRLTDEGLLEVGIIKVNEVSTYCFWFHQDLIGGLHVNAVVRIIDTTPVFEELVQGVETLARNRNCRYVRFNTARLGLIDLARKHGYGLNSVCLTKLL